MHVKTIYVNWFLVCFSSRFSSGCIFSWIIGSDSSHYVILTSQITGETIQNKIASEYLLPCVCEELVVFTNSAYKIAFGENECSNSQLQYTCRICVCVFSYWIVSYFEVYFKTSKAISLILLFIDVKLMSFYLILMHQNLRLVW